MRSKRVFNFLAIGLCFFFLALQNTQTIFPLEGSHKSCPVLSIINAIPSCNDPHGLTFDGEYLWCSSLADRTIYKLDMFGDVLHTIDTPASCTAGLAYKDNSIWSADYCELIIYQLDPFDGHIIQSFDAPGTDSTGLVWVNNRLWNGDFNYLDGEIGYLHRIRITKKGTKVTTYESPGPEPIGLAFDGQNLWNPDYRTRNLYMLDLSAKTRCEYDFPSPNPSGLTFDGVHLWVADYEELVIYQVDIGK